MRVETCAPDFIHAWLRLRQELWPQPEAAHPWEAEDIIARRAEAAAFIVRDSMAGNAIGFAEVTLRHDYVNGCESSPVAFLEEIYVRPAFRRRGAARLLADAVRA